MALPNNLLRRDGTYYARIYIPQDLQPAFEGKTEKWRSLRTKDPWQARSRLAAVLNEWASTFADMRRRRNVTKDDLQAVIFDHYSAKLEQGDRERQTPTADEIWQAFEAAEKSKAQEPTGDGMFDVINSMTDVEILASKAEWASRRRQLRLGRLRGDLGSGDTRLIEPDVDRVIRERGFLLDKGSDRYRELCFGLMRAEIEALQRTREREAGDFTGRIEDPIVAEPPTREGESHAPGETLMQLFARYEADNPTGMRPETMKQVRRDVQLFADFVGPRVPVDRITRKLVGDFKDVLLAFPVRAADTKAFQGMTPQQIVDANKAIGKPAINRKTVNKCLSSLSGFSNWLEARGRLESNPVQGLMTKPKGQDAKKGKPATFTSEQLTILFNSPLFVGSAGDTWKQVKQPGTHLIRDHRFWTPLIMMFSGARPGEIAQLHVTDVRLEGSIWLIDINDEDGKRLKRQSSRRRVPIHSELVRLGLLEYHEKMVAAGQRQLFPEVEIPEVGQIAAQFSREFNRLLQRLGIKSDQSLRSYSFRHGFIDRARAGGSLDHQIALVVGHDESLALMGKVQTSDYGVEQQGTLKFRRDIVESVTYPGLTLDHLVPASEPEPLQCLDN